MSSGFTHEENVLKATCSFESETLFTRTAERIIWLICFNYILCESVVIVSQWRDDGLQSRVLGSIQTQQRLHQPQLPVTGRCDYQWWYIYCLFQFLIRRFFFFFFCSSFLSHLSPWPETDTTTRDRWGRKHLSSSSLHCGNNHPGSVHESRSEGLDQPDDRKGFHLVLHLIWFMNVNKIINNFPPGRTNKPFYQFFRWKRESSLPREYLFSTCFPRRGKQIRN